MFNVSLVTNLFGLINVCRGIFTFLNKMIVNDICYEHIILSDEKASSTTKRLLFDLQTLKSLLSIKNIRFIKSNIGLFVNCILASPTQIELFN